jgi:hypothetical protein
MANIVAFRVLAVCDSMQTGLGICLMLIDRSHRLAGDWVGPEQEQGTEHHGWAGEEGQHRDVVLGFGGLLGGTRDDPSGGNEHSTDENSE